MHVAVLAACEKARTGAWGRSKEDREGSYKAGLIKQGSKGAGRELGVIAEYFENAGKMVFVRA